MGSGTAGAEVTFPVAQFGSLAAMQPGSPTNIRVIIAGVVTGIVAVPVPGIIIVIPVPGTVISVIAVVEMRSQIPGIVEPGIPIPRIIIQGAIPIAETPRPVIPGIVVPGL